MTRVAESPVELRHISVVGGLLSEWNALGDPGWRERISDFGKVADHAGAKWLTIRPLDRIAPPDGGAPASITRVGRCPGVVDPQTDGRRRLVEAITVLPRDGRSMGGAIIAELVGAPARCDRAVAIIIGPASDFPLRLVWEWACCGL